MSLSLNTQARNAFMDITGNTVFNSGKIAFYTGSKPATANLAPTGTLLCEFTLGADAFGAASTGTITLSGTPLQDASANGTGTAGYFRLKAASDDDSLNGAFARIDGTITATGGGGDITVDNTSINAGQVINLTAFSLTLPAA